MIKSFLKIAISFAAFVGLWQISAETLDIPRYILPKPSDIFAAFWELREILIIDTVVTAAQAAGGFLMASAVSLGLSIITVYFPLTKNTILSSAIVIKSVPIIIFAPLFLIWFGYGVVGKTVLAGIVTFLPLLISLIQGMSAPTRAEQDLFKMYKASRKQTILKLLLPKSVPFVIAGLRIAAPMAILGSLIAETAGAKYGLGITMMVASANQNTQLVFAAAFLSGMLGLVAFSLVVLLERLAAKYTRA